MQVRGSIPLYWTQPADWKIRPPVLTVPSTQLFQHSQALKTHLVDIVSSYFSPLWCQPKHSASTSTSTGKEEPGGLPQPSADTLSESFKTGAPNSISIINLVDKRGVQGKLGQLWHKALQMVFAQPVPVLQRYGAYFSDTVRSTAAYKIGTSEGADGGDSELVNEEGKGEDNNIVPVPQQDEILDRNATTVLEGTLHVTAEDLLCLHFVRDPPQHSRNTSSSHAPWMEQRPLRGAPALLCENSCRITETAQVATKLIWFDYHHKCHDSAAAVLELFPLLQNAIHTDHSLYVHTNTSPPSASSAPTLTSESRASNVRVISTQKHIIRTNCMDCLDRTNVVQSVISRWALMRQIVSLRDAEQPVVATVAAADASASSETGDDSSNSNHHSASAASARLLRVNNYKSLELPDKVTKYILSYDYFVLRTD